MLASAACLSIPFLVNERLAPKPFLNLSLLKRRNFSLGPVMFLVFNMARGTEA